MIRQSRAVSCGAYLSFFRRSSMCEKRRKSSRFADAPSSRGSVATSETAVTEKPVSETGVQTKKKVKGSRFADAKKKGDVSSAEVSVASPKASATEETRLATRAHISC